MLREWCVKMKAAYKMYYMKIVFVGCVAMCSTYYLEGVQMQIREKYNLDTARRYALPHYTKEDAVYIPRVISSPYCKSRTLSKHYHRRAHSYTFPVPSTKLHDYQYKKEMNTKSPYQQAINPYFFQNPNLQSLFDVNSPLENDKRNKRAANVNSGDGNLSNNPALQASIDTIFGSTIDQHNADTLLNNPGLQANIENIFGPKPTASYVTDEQYRHNNDKNSNNPKEQSKLINDQHATSSKSLQYPKLQTAIVNLYGPPVMPYLEDDKTLEAKYQYDDTENTGQEHRFRGVETLISIHNKSDTTERTNILTHAAPRATDGPQNNVETQEPAKDSELDKKILEVYGTPPTSAATYHSDATESSHKVNSTDPKSGNANDTELVKQILEVYGTPPTSAATYHSVATESSHKVNSTDPKSGNANDTEDVYHFPAPAATTGSLDRTPSGSPAQETSFFMYLLCLPIFISFFI